jgi:ribosomal protein L37AE/L43A
MKDLLKQAVQSLINGDLDAAKTYHSQYVQSKSKAILEKLEGNLVQGHCDSCGESATTSKGSVVSGKWECGHCGGKKFDQGSDLKESNAYDVFLNGKLIDTVFDSETDPAEVKKSLINHDGYDAGIKVTKAKEKKKKK